MTKDAAVEVPYSIVIGLEVHVQLLTETKLFCGCPTRFGAPPNSQTCPVCIGMPGVLPVMNRRAYELALRTALALECDIADFTKWDRKHYYYPDLPKNYQISQYDLPFASGGRVRIQRPAGTRAIGLIRVHLEEDAGKNLHSESGGDSLVDLNRTGTPLLEIVSAPEITSPFEAAEYLNTLRTLLVDLDVSDCEMQEGSLRCDANINLHIPHQGSVAKTPIVEVKNMNSIRAVERAMEYEAERQYAEWQKTGKVLGSVPKQTRGWDDPKGMTRPQREKEEASDYRYFPEPDLVPVVVRPEWLEAIRKEIRETSDDRRRRYREQLSLPEYQADTLVAKGRAVSDFFEELVRLGVEAKAAANWVLNDLLGHSVGRLKTMHDLPLTPPELAELIGLVKGGQINLNDAREKLLPAMLETKRSAGQLAKDMGLAVVADTAAIEQAVDEVLVEMAKAVADYRGGKAKALDSIFGQVMRRGKGKFPPALVKETLLARLGR